MDKNIFQYSDGQRQRFGDPIRIDRVLTAYCDGDPWRVLKFTKSPDPEIANQATEQLLDAIRKAFDLPPFNPETGEGCTEETLFDALDAYMDYVQKKNLNIERLATSPPSTALPEPPQLLGSSPATKPTSDCGCKSHV